ncbi:MAG TPA: MarR family transcriptional regulator [Trebonia sp.]|nr:MarR family transcriptional regulator [Trebonia sp.]
MSIESREPGAARAEESAPALSRDILDALTTLIKQAEPVWHSIADGFGVAPPHLLAMFKLEGGLAMKDLAQRLGCDASFVTAIADNLEKRGFLRREPGLRDRRVKNLMLTEEGLAAKDRLMTQLAAKMPWCYALDEEERQCFLGLLRKMLDTPDPGAAGNGNRVHGQCTPDPRGGTPGDTARADA